MNPINNNRTIAKLTGYSIIFMAVVAGFSFGFALPKIYNLTKIDTYQSSLIANLQLYKFMLLGVLVVLVLDLLVAWTLYLYFKSDSKKLALLSFSLRFIYTVIFSIATYFLVKNIGEVNNEVIVGNYVSFQNIWSIGLIIFGSHLIVVGVLMKIHKLIPKILYYLMIVAGAAYILVHLLKTISPLLTELNGTLNNILGLPMALGELGLALWLLAKGEKSFNNN